MKRGIIMKLFKKFVGLGAALTIALGLFVSFSFGEEREEIHAVGVSVADILRNNNDGDISLDDFDPNKKQFDGCYGNQLDDVSRAIYDCLVDNIENSKNGTESFGNEKYLKDVNFNEKQQFLKDYNYIEFPNLTVDDIEKNDYAVVKYAIMAFDYDYPEVFWIDFDKTTYWRVPGDDCCYVSIVVNDKHYDDEIEEYLPTGYTNYYCNGADYTDVYTSRGDVENDIAKIKNVCKDVHKEIKDMDLYKKIEYINSFLVDRNEYNRFLLRGDDTETLDQRIWKCVSALIYGKPGWEEVDEPKEPTNPVCEGYSRAFKVLCDYEGIDCVLAQGNQLDENGEIGGAHMWNYVKMYDDKWYAVDCTANDPLYPQEPSPEDREYNKKNCFLAGSDKLEEINFEDRNDVMYPGIIGLNYPILEEEDFIQEIKGDVDGNGKREAKDAADLLKRVLNGTVTERDKRVAKFSDERDSITAEDVAVVLGIANGEINIPED